MNEWRWTIAVSASAFVVVFIITYLQGYRANVFYSPVSRSHLLLAVLVAVTAISAILSYEEKLVLVGYVGTFSAALPHFSRQCNTVLPGGTTWSTQIGIDLPHSLTLCPFVAPESAISVQLLLGPVVGALLYATVFGTVAATVGLVARRLLNDRASQP